MDDRVAYPPEPLPSPLLNSEEGSFAYNTIVTRLPAIARLVIAENDFPPDINGSLHELADDLHTGFIRYLRDDVSPDHAAWDGYLRPYVGLDWLSVPWYFSEAYFYRRILEATRYFVPGPTYEWDPFTQQKRAGLQAALAPLRPLARRLNGLIAGRHGWDEASFRLLAYYGLWGNRVDLSLWPAGTPGHDPDQVEMPSDAANVLVDDTSTVARLLSGLQAADIRFITDNAGSELVCDLCLVDYLLACGVAGTVTLHVKAHPTYVSDVMVKDVHHTVATLAASADAEVRAVAARWQGYLDGERLRMRANLFWTAPLAFWEMPDVLRSDLAAAASLIFIKGDCNYRRLLGDRHWPYTTRIAEVTRHFPAPFVALRTLKSELAVGLAPEQPAALAAADPHWLTDGHYGVIQYVNPA